MYEVKIYSFGKEILSKKFNEDKYDEVKSFYKKYMNSLDQYAPFLFINGERLKVFDAEDYLDLKKEFFNY